MQYSIGEFSKIAQVSLKALRLYHEKDILRPDFVDSDSGYRFYTDSQIYEIQVIQALKTMGFSLNEIKAILDEMEDDSDLVELLEAKKREIEKKVRSFNQSIQQIESILTTEKNAMNAEDLVDRIEEKRIPAMLIAGYRMKGQYSEVGKGFAKIGKHAGRHIAGKAMCIYYDGEYKETDADFEPCFEIKKAVDHPEIHCRTISGGRALTIIHKGPYNRLGDSYKIIFDFAKTNGIHIQKESREIYLKGPGMILKGNPNKYLTEIQLFVEEEAPEQND